MSEEIKNVDLDLCDRAYVVYDTQLKLFQEPFISNPVKVKDIFTKFVNNPSSPYFGNESNFILYEQGYFDDTTGLIQYKPLEQVCNLDSLIDDEIRKIQICIQTLNFLPNGYFKMPKEYQESIQEKIDKAIEFYTKEFIQPSLDVKTSEASIDN